MGLLDKADDHDFFGTQVSHAPSSPFPRMPFEQTVLESEISDHLVQDGGSRRKPLTSSEVASRAVVTPVRRLYAASMRSLDQR
jgi:hypothetical protein